MSSSHYHHEDVFSERLVLRHVREVYTRVVKQLIKQHLLGALNHVSEPISGDNRERSPARTIRYRGWGRKRIRIAFNCKKVKLFDLWRLYSEMPLKMFLPPPLTSSKGRGIGTP